MVTYPIVLMLALMLNLNQSDSLREDASHCARMLNAAVHDEDDEDEEADRDAQCCCRRRIFIITPGIYFIRRCLLLSVIPFILSAPPRDVTTHALASLPEL